MESEIFLQGFEYLDDSHFDWDTNFNVDESFGPYSTYLKLYLRRGKSTWVVDTPMTKDLPPGPLDCPEISRHVFGVLEIIVPLLQTVAFTEAESSKLIYLTPVSGSGDFRLIKSKRQRKRTFSKSRIWLPLIPETSIVCTEWYSHRTMLGRWNGREVCVWQVHAQKTLDILEVVMRGLWLIRDADLFFTPLGHLTQDDDIVGLVFEPMQGRMVDYRDRALVYDAFYKLKQLNVALAPKAFPAFENVSFGFEERIMIVDGKVRFTIDALPFFVPWHPTPEEIEEGSLLNKMLLDSMFRKLSSLGANPEIPMHLQSHTLLHLAQTPSLRSIFTLLAPPQIFCQFTEDDSLQLPFRRRNRSLISPHNENDKERRQRQKGRQTCLLVASERDAFDTQKMQTYRRYTTSKPPATSMNSRYNDEPYRGIVGATHCKRSQATSTNTSRSKTSIKLLLANDDYDGGFARFRAESSSRFQECE